MAVIRFTHLTDLHLPIPASPPTATLLNKRALGYLSWVRNRRFRHDKAALEIITADASASKADLNVITGDIVNIALPAEFTAARNWLDTWFRPETTVFCPGNHDTYVATPWASGLGQLAHFMRGQRSGDAMPGPDGAHDFPYLRTIGDVVFIIANSSPPTAPGFASGKLGRAQIDAIEKALKAAGENGRCRVLALHHPITHHHVSRRKGLDDARELRAALDRAGVELVIHGHTHFPSFETVETKAGPRPIAGGGSASHPHRRGRYRPARYTRFSVDRSGPGWTITAEVRELDPADGTVKTAETRRLL